MLPLLIQQKTFIFFPKIQYGRHITGNNYRRFAPQILKYVPGSEYMCLIILILTVHVTHFDN